MDNLPEKPASAIQISFVIPAFNESRYIKICLESIRERCASAGITPQIVVVDNGSTDDTAEIARLYTDNVHSIGRASVSHARNLGVQHCDNELIALIDADVEITSVWVRFLVEQYDFLINNPLFLTGFQCLVPENGTWVQRFWFDNIEDSFLGGANMITSRKAFDVLNGFDDSLLTGEDYDFCIRAINLKLNYFANENFRAIHHGFPDDIKGFLKREIWHGEGDFSSFEKFIKSPVSLIALLYFVFHILIIVSFVTSKYTIGFYLVLLLFLINSLITLKRFYQCNIFTIVVNSFLNYGYFLARGVSFIICLNKKYTFLGRSE